MFVWHDFMHWPFRYYFTQIAMTLAIVFAGTLTATFIALLLSFFAARNIMKGGIAGVVAFLMRRLFDMLRGVDMAIWGLIFVSAVGLGPLAGVLAIIMQDTGLLGRLYAENHEAVDRSPGRGLTAVGATVCKNTALAPLPSRSRPFCRSASIRLNRIPGPRRCWALSARAGSA
jgi:phosphonate transport system permease protein